MKNIIVILGILMLVGFVGADGVITTDDSGEILTLRANGTDIYFQADDDVTNYLTLSSDAMDLTLATTDGADLKINAAGGDIIFESDIAKTQLKVMDDNGKQFIFSKNNATAQPYGSAYLYTDDSDIAILANDLDDYLSFSTVANVSRISVVGGSTAVLTSDDISAAALEICHTGDPLGDALLMLTPDNTCGTNAKRASITLVSGGTPKGMRIYIYNDSYNTFYFGEDNQYDFGDGTHRIKNGYIANAWTVGDLVFNYGTVNGSGGTNYRIVEAEKLTNDKLHGLMYVMEGKAVMWIEPSGKLHTTQEIDTSWEGITGLTFDKDGGVYKNGEVVRYPAFGEYNKLPPDYVDDGKKEYAGDLKINKVLKKPEKYVSPEKLCKIEDKEYDIGSKSCVTTTTTSTTLQPVSVEAQDISAVGQSTDIQPKTHALEDKELTTTSDTLPWWSFLWGG